MKTQGGRSANHATHLPSQHLQQLSHPVTQPALDAAHASGRAGQCHFFLSFIPWITYPQALKSLTGFRPSTRQHWSCRCKSCFRIKVCHCVCGCCTGSLSQTGVHNDNQLCRYRSMLSTCPVNNRTPPPAFAPLGFYRYTHTFVVCSLKRLLSRAQQKVSGNVSARAAYKLKMTSLFHIDGQQAVSMASTVTELANMTIEQTGCDEDLFQSCCGGGAGVRGCSEGAAAAGAYCSAAGPAGPGQ